MKNPSFCVKLIWNLVPMVTLQVLKKGLWLFRLKFHLCLLISCSLQHVPWPLISHSVWKDDATRIRWEQAKSKLLHTFPVFKKLSHSLLSEGVRFSGYDFYNRMRPQKSVYCQSFWNHNFLDETPSPSARERYVQELPHFSHHPRCHEIEAVKSEVKRV